jgi:hypothetical protein
MLYSTAVATTAAIEKAFASIGVSAATAMPPSRRNAEPVAWEYLVATALDRLATTRQGKALRAAINAGIIFDPAKAPRAAGTVETVYAGDVVTIGVSVGTPRTSLDFAAFVDALVKKNVDRAVIEKATAANTHPTRAPHAFNAKLVTR